MQDEINRIRIKNGYADQVVKDPIPLASSFCSGLKAYVSAAPDGFKAVRKLERWDDNPASIHEWDATPGLPNFGTCTITEAARTSLSCTRVTWPDPTDADLYAGLLKDVESCLSGWTKDAGERYTRYTARQGTVSVAVDLTVVPNRTTRTLTIYRDRGGSTLDPGGENGSGSKPFSGDALSSGENGSDTPPVGAVIDWSSCGSRRLVRSCSGAANRSRWACQRRARTVGATLMPVKSRIFNPDRGQMSAPAFSIGAQGAFCGRCGSQTR